MFCFLIIFNSKAQYLFIFLFSFCIYSQLIESLYPWQLFFDLYLDIQCVAQSSQHERIWGGEEFEQTRWTGLLINRAEINQLSVYCATAVLHSYETPTYSEERNCEHIESAEWFQVSQIHQVIGRSFKQLSIVFLKRIGVLLLHKY